MSMTASGMRPLLGIALMTALAWGLSEKRRAVSWRLAGLTLGVHGALVLLLRGVPQVREGVLWISHGVQKLGQATQAGTQFVFGYLGGGASPFLPVEGASGVPFIFAFQALPMVMVVSALSMVLFHWNILPPVIRGLGRVFGKVLGLGEPMGLLLGAKIFLGQTDAPMLVRPWLGRFSRSELFAVLACGMATTSSAIMVVYAAVLQGTVDQPLQHILTVSVTSLPAALFFARLMVPGVEAPTRGDAGTAEEGPGQTWRFRSTMDAVARGTADGLSMFLGILAMLVVILALVALVNMILGGVFPMVGGEPVTLQGILGWVMAPLAWMMGVPWSEAPLAGQLLGTKVVTNEMVAFLDLARHGHALSPCTRVIMTCALCGFANISSIGIVMAAFSTLAPERKEDIASLAPRAVVAGTLATCLGGTTAGLMFTLFP
jgi:CNT family concentrative nucleoside transporter